MKLTKAQTTALLELQDGRDHHTWKRASGKNGNVNFIAANSLRKLGLVQFVMRYGRDQVRATELGLALLNNRELLNS